MLLVVAMSQPLLAARFVDAIVAEVDMHTIAASDIGLAKALGLYGQTPSTGLVGKVDIDRFIDARLIITESVRLNIHPPAQALAKAWRELVVRHGGMGQFREWLKQNGIDEEWARQMVHSDARRKYFIQLRFARFVFIPEEAITQALGFGRHGSEERDRAMEKLRQAQTDQDLARWLQQQRKRATIRWFFDKEVPDPFAPNLSDGEPSW